MENGTKMLQNKRILLFAPTFFNYHIKIKNALEEFGAKVHVYDERNNPSSIKKILIRKAKFLLNGTIYKYYRQVCNTEKSFNADYILFVNPESITSASLELLKETFPNSKYILYMWDSLKNKKINELLHYFDRVLSFDPEDCKKYNMIFRPLFFLPEFQKDTSHTKGNAFQYDFCFIGTIHSDRAKLLYAIKELCDKNHLKYYYYLFIPGKVLFFLRFCTDRFLRKFDKQYVHLESIKSAEIASISAMSKCVIDINHPKQTGLTMRTIEMLGLKKKVLTTNENIVKYDFFRPENQIVFNRDNLHFNIEAIQKDYTDIPEDILERYSVYGWIKDLFSFGTGHSFCR